MKMADGNKATSATAELPRSGEDDYGKDEQGEIISPTLSPLTGGTSTSNTTTCIDIMVKISPIATMAIMVIDLIF